MGRFVRAISSPSRSGTTHLTVETILQGEGWNKGWEQLLAICANSAAITERSFGVPDGVNNGQFGIGLVIDFFGLAGKYSGFPVEFAYPDVTAVVHNHSPAVLPFGIVKGARLLPVCHMCGFLGGTNGDGPPLFPADR